MKTKSVISVESVMKIIEAKQPSSLSQLAHYLGYKGSISSSVTKKLRGLIPDIDALIKGTAKPKGKPEALAVKWKAKVPGKVVMTTKGATLGHVKAAGAKAGKYAHDPRNPFKRQGSSYSVCFDILASSPAGLNKEKLIRLLAVETKKDLKRAGYDAQVLLSAHPNDNGLSNNDSPRHRSCRPGFWIKRENGGHVQLMVD